MERSFNTTGFLGDHLSLNKYTDKYEKNPNIEEIRQTLQKQTNSQSLHEVTLRNSFYGEPAKTYSKEKGWYKFTLKKKELDEIEKMRKLKVKRRMDYIPPKEDKFDILHDGKS
jgi:hypothetical protein